MRFVTFKILLIVILMLIAFIGFTQDTRPFGALTSDEVRENYSTEYPDADGIILSDQGVTKFVKNDQGGFEIQFVRTKRIKILNEEGLRFADVFINLYVSESGKVERAEDIKAVTYNIDNGYLQKDFLNEGDIFGEIVSDNLRRKTFAIPKARVGSVIEYQYTFVTPFLFNLPDWEFQSTIPTLWSMYRFELIPYYSYIYIGQGMTEFDHFENWEEKYKSVSSGGGYGTLDLMNSIFEIGMRDIPAFESEAFITSKDDFIMKLDFQLAHVNHSTGGITDVITTYPKMIKDLLKDDRYGKYISKSERAAKELVEGLDLNDKTEIEKVRLIVEAVQSAYIFNGAARIYARQSPKELISNNRGNSAEINLFLVGALRAAGIKSDPVLLSTRDHGKINRDYPILTFFNYSVALASVGNNKVLLDATSDRLPFNKIPPRCFNGSGLIVNDNDVRWVELSTAGESSESISIDHSLNVEKGTLEGFCVMNSTGYEGYHRRFEFEDDKSEIEKFFTRHFNEIDNYKTYGYDTPTQAYVVGVQGSKDVEAIGENFLLQPFSSFPMQENKLKAESRSYPVDFTYPYLKNYLSRIKIPEGYKVSDFPSEIHVDNELLTINYKCTFENQTIVTSGEVNFKRAVYYPEEYQALKKHLDNIVTYFNSPVLVEKI